MKTDLLDEGLMSVNDAAAFLGVSRQTVWRMARDGSIAWTRVGRHRRIPRSALKAYAAKGLVINGVAINAIRP